MNWVITGGHRLSEAGEKGKALRMWFGCTIPGFANAEVIYVGDAMSDYLAASENSIRFIARIHDNESIFKGIERVDSAPCTVIGGFSETVRQLDYILPGQNFNP